MECNGIGWNSIRYFYFSSPPIQAHGIKYNGLRTYNLKLKILPFLHFPMYFQITGWKFLSILWYPKSRTAHLFHFIPLYIIPSHFVPFYSSDHEISKHRPSLPVRNPHMGFYMTLKRVKALLCSQWKTFSHMFSLFQNKNMKKKRYIYLRKIFTLALNTSHVHSNPWA